LQFHPLQQPCKMQISSNFSPFQYQFLKSSFIINT
jgi:hypothetical protein